MKVRVSATALLVAHLLVSPSLADEQDIGQKLIGQWEGPRHIRAYYSDGSFTLDPRPGDKPLGMWKLRGHQLITQFAEEPTPMIERIVKITDTEMVSIYKGMRYTYKRVVHP